MCAGEEQPSGQSYLVMVLGSRPLTPALSPAYREEGEKPNAMAWRSHKVETGRGLGATKPYGFEAWDCVARTKRDRIKQRSGCWRVPGRPQMSHEQRIFIKLLLFSRLGTGLLPLAVGFLSPAGSTTAGTDGAHETEPLGGFVYPVGVAEGAAAL